WAPGEDILIIRQQAAGDRTRMALRVKADNSGNFTDDSLKEADNKVSAYILTAIGEQSGYVAQTNYRSAPAPDPKDAGRKPVKYSFKMPVNGQPGSMETPLGTLQWAPREESSRSGLTPQGDPKGTVGLSGCVKLGPADLCGD